MGSPKEDTTVVVVSYSGKEINAKLVYYGAGLSGKTTNLEAIYEAVPETSRGKMVSMKTQSDRTLFFDLLPLDLGEIMGFKTRFLLYTVPGQVFYNATRKLVLKGADAIVFVADSEVGKMEENKESLGNLRANLAEYNLNLDQIPWVIQYNKRDLPNIYTLDELNAELNQGGKVPFFEAVATEGKGVFETFRGISHLLMEKVTKDLRRTPSATTTSRPAAVVEEPPPPPMSKTPPAPATPLAPPARSIQREALATPELAADPGGGLDYGREIELPDSIPPATRGRGASTHQPAPAPVAAARPTGRRATDVAPEAPARVPSAPARHVASAAVSRDEPETHGAAVVVPVQIPKGAGREIVLRIVITTED
jgi:signal recognition particle receptor subunit beta